MKAIIGFLLLWIGTIFMVLINLFGKRASSSLIEFATGSSSGDILCVLLVCSLMLLFGGVTYIDSAVCLIGILASLLAWSVQYAQIGRASCRERVCRAV